MTHQENRTFSRRRTLTSALWATAQQAITLGATAASGIILARVLSVSDFGVFSYATSLATMGTVVVTAGLSTLAVKMLVDESTGQRTLMSALVLTREFFAVVAYIVLVAVSTSSSDSTTVAASAIALCVLFARAFDATELWFQSRVESAKTAPVRIGVVLLMLAIRLTAAAADAPLKVFLVLYVAESTFVTIALALRYLFASDSPRFGRVGPSVPFSLLRKSWLLLLSGVAAQVNARGDVLVIQGILGSSSVGIYAAASRLSEIFYFLPVVFMTASFPRLLGIRREHGPRSHRYKAELQRSYDQSCWVGIGFAVLIVVAGPTAIELLYGDRYSAAGAILRIHVLALPFVFMAAVFSKWIIAENLLVASFIRHLLGACINIGLNFWLIPKFGLVGAAYATLTSYVIASYLSCFLTRSTRPAGIQMTLALVAPIRVIHHRRQRTLHDRRES